MSSYWELLRSSSNYVLFLYNDNFDESDKPIPEKLRADEIKCAYVDYLEIVQSKQHLANAIAQPLKLEHAPYRARMSPNQIEEWVPFLDDLISLSPQEKGIAIIIDNADILLAQNQRTMVKLIEAFLIQFHHWFLKKKPCHLCFQMEKNELVRQLFGLQS